MKRTFNFCIIIAFAIFIGCEVATDDTDTSVSKEGTHTHSDGTTHVDHGHSHNNPPHGGTYADWGGGAYHVEFTVDHDKQQAIVYILGDDAVTDAPIEAEEINLSIADPKVQIALKAQPLASDGEGKSSRFVGTHENLGIVQEYEGKIYGSVGDKAYSGNFKEESHKH